LTLRSTFAVLIRLLCHECYIILLEEQRPETQWHEKILRGIKVTAKHFLLDFGETKKLPEE